MQLPSRLPMGPRLATPRLGFWYRRLGGALRVGLLVVASGSPLHAQSAAPSSSGAPSSAAPSSGASAAPGEEAVAAGEEGAAADSAETEQARAEAAQRFQRGLAFYGDGDYSLALIEFDRAYQLVPNYRVLYNIAQVSIQLGRFARAREALEQYVREGGDALPEDRLEAVRRDLSMLADRTAYLELQVDEAGAEVLVDDRSYGQTPLAEPLLLDAGEHRLVVRKSGFSSFSRRVTLAGAERLPLAVTLSPLKEDKQVVIVQRPEDDGSVPKSVEVPPAVDRAKGPSPALIGWLTTGALAVGATVTGAFGLSAAGRHDELANTPDVDPDELSSAAGEAQALLVTADILTGAAIVAGGVSLYLTLKKSGAKESVALTSGQAPGVDRGTARHAELVFGLNRVLLRGHF